MRQLLLLPLRHKRKRHNDFKTERNIRTDYTYDEFGNSEAVSETSLLTNEYSYTGAISDSITGLTYLCLKYYDKGDYCVHRI